MRTVGILEEIAVNAIWTSLLFCLFTVNEFYIDTVC